MIDLSENVKMSFGAKYVAEDTASYMLYKFDRSVLDGRAVPMERLARCLGLEVACEYVCGDCTESLGIVAFEPQRVYFKDRCKDFSVPTAVVERDIIDRGESGLYSLTLALMCAEFLFYGTRHKLNENGQLSFGFETVASRNNRKIVLSEAFEEIVAERDGSAGFALKLLLPKNGFKRQVAEIYSELGINRATLDEEQHLPLVLATLSERYNVPELAVMARLRQLNLC